MKEKDISLIEVQETANEESQGQRPHSTIKRSHKVLDQRPLEAVRSCGGTFEDPPKVLLRPSGVVRGADTPEDRHDDASAIICN